MAHTFDTLDRPREPRVLSAASSSRESTRPDDDGLVISPREADQTQTNRLTFVGLAFLALIVIAAISIVF